MRELYIFRIFTLFPLVGIMVPDIATVLHSSLRAISVDHVIVDISLVLCALISSAGIWYQESKTLKTA